MPKGLLAGKVDRQGRIVCPHCGQKLEIPPDRWVTRGKANCAIDLKTKTVVGHTFLITDDVAYAANDILKKTREGKWRKTMVGNFEATPKFLQPEKDGKKLILPGQQPDRRPGIDRS